MRLLGEETRCPALPLEHRDLQACQQRLDAVGQVLRLEDEVEQHRDELDRHRLELRRLLAERGLLQVAEDVCMPPGRRETGSGRRRRGRIRIRLLQARQALAQCRRRDDRHAGRVARWRRAQRSLRDPRAGRDGHLARRSSPGAARMPRQGWHCAAEAAAEQRHEVDSLPGTALSASPACARRRRRCPLGRLRGCAGCPPAHAGGHDVQVGEVLVDVRVDGIDLAQRPWLISLRTGKLSRPSSMTSAASGNGRRWRPARAGWPRSPVSGWPRRKPKP